MSREFTDSERHGARGDGRTTSLDHGRAGGGAVLPRTTAGLPVRRQGVPTTEGTVGGQGANDATDRAPAAGDDVFGVHLDQTDTAATGPALGSDGAAKARMDGFEGTAVAYVDHNQRRIMLAARSLIAAADWPLGHARLVWATDDQGAIARAITDHLVGLAEARGSTVYLAPFWHPVDLWTIVDRNRRLTEGAPGDTDGERPTARGPLRDDSVVDEAVAVELMANLRTSFARMVPRFLAAADDNRPEPVPAGQLVTSAPVDRLWARVLADPKLVRHTQRTGAVDEAPTPDGPGVFRGGLRPVTYEWMGSQDVRLWNVLRVTEPTDATREEVAATLYRYPGVSTVQSFNAFALTDAAPFFVLPHTWAKAFPDAVRWASAEHARDRDQPVDAVLTSSAFHEAALAQGKDEAARPIARGKASHGDTERLLALLWRGSDQLGYVAEQLAAWKLSPQVEAAQSWIQRRASALVGETPQQVATWAPVIEAQQRTIVEASAAVVEVIAAAQAAGIKPDNPNAGACRRTLGAYAATLGTSHLADLARQRLASADAERQQLVLSFVEGALADATRATDSLRSAEGGAFGPDSDGGQLHQQRRDLQGRKTDLRADMLAGQPLDGDRAEDLTIEAGTVAVRARARELAQAASALSVMLAGTENATLLSGIAAAFDSRFESLPDQLFALSFDCITVERELAGAGHLEHLSAAAPTTPEAQQALDRRLRGLRRQALAEAQAKLATLPAKHGLDRLQREALDAVSDNQLATLALTVITLIAASVVTAGAGAWVGGGARTLAAYRLGMSTERATQIGAAVNVGVDSALTAGAQTLVAGDSFGTATAENVLANVGVRAALSRFAPLMGAFDEEAKAVWQAGDGAAQGTVVLAKGAMVTAELVTAAGVSYVAQRIVRGQPPPSDDDTTAWFIQGASMAIGRMIAVRTTELHARLDHAGARAVLRGTHASLIDRVRAQAKLAGQVSAGGDADGAMRLLIENRSLLAEESRMLRELDADPARAAAVGMSAQDRFRFGQDNAAAQADTAKRGMDVLPLRLAGVDEVIPGALWKGSSEQIATAIYQARAVGIRVAVVEHGNRKKHWRVQLGDSERVLEIEERDPTPQPGSRAPRPRAAGVSDEAGAILHAKAAAALARIRVTVAPTPGTSRGSYYVTHADGRRMSELFDDLNGVEVVNFKAGLLVRHGSDEWYFEFHDRAHTLDGAGRAVAIDQAAGGLGLPASNVATIEIWGFRGVRTIQKPADKQPRDLTADEKAKRDEVVAEEGLLHAGHVGVSFDGGRTIWGFNPIYQGRGMTAEEVGNKLKNHEVLPGIVTDDTSAFAKAKKHAEIDGWNTGLERAVVMFSRADQPEIVADIVAFKSGKKPPPGYSFPLRKPGADGENFQGGTDYNGRVYCASEVRNCATFPEKLGIPIPEPSGNMIKYMPELKKWADADAPIDARTKEPDDDIP